MGTDTQATGDEAGVNWRSVVWITGAALALYAGFRVLPTGTNLHHMDFQVSGANALEMCDPTRPQFIPVVAARSPVRLELRAEGGAVPVVGEAGRFVLTLTTSAGKAIAPVDLLTVHTRKLHLLVIDPTLRDYQHLHPEPGELPGEWVFAHTPRRAGVYRVFADFTPAATGRGLYSFADYTVDGEAAAAGRAGEDVAMTRLGEEAAEGAWRFRLATRDGAAVRAGVATTLVFSGRELAGGAVPLTLVMDAYAHLVAFDPQRSGFAHLHPRGERPGDYAVKAPDAREPKLFFDLMIPTPGRYVVWAQVNLQGGERFLPFEIEVGF
ncbi:MAG: hypothetical protein H7067_19765 [Burkholderiales bacterium]|nr:hypothetical protein [Opitutaceae bacterium]